MKITVPLKAIDIMGLLNAAADFHVGLCGNEDHLFAYLGTEQQRIERYDRDITEFYAEDNPTPFSPPSGPPQRLFHEHPAKSKFLAAPLKATASEKHQRNGAPNTSFIRAPLKAMASERHR